MGLPHNVTKQLAAASVNNICASQNPGAGAFILNGSTSNRLSTTTTAATPAGVAGTSNILTLTSTAGVVAGQAVTDSTAAGVIVPGTVVVGKTATTVTLNQPVGGAGVGSGDTIVFAGTATLDTQRRVLFTPAGAEVGVLYTIVGTNDAGQPIGEVVVGVSNPATVASVLDYKTITSITSSGSVGNVQVGTNTTGATPWFPLNWHAEPFNVELSGTAQSGSVTWGWQYVYLDPNNLPAGVTLAQMQIFNHPTLAGQTGALDGPVNDPVAAIRFIVTAGTGQALGTWIESGITGA